VCLSGFNHLLTPRYIFPSQARILSNTRLAPTGSLRSCRSLDSALTNGTVCSNSINSENTFLFFMNQLHFRVKCCWGALRAHQFLNFQSITHSCSRVLVSYGSGIVYLLSCSSHTRTLSPPLTAAVAPAAVVEVERGSNHLKLLRRSDRDTERGNL